MNSPRIEPAMFGIRASGMFEIFIHPTKRNHGTNPNDDEELVGDISLCVNKFQSRSMLRNMKYLVMLQLMLHLVVLQLRDGMLHLVVLQLMLHLVMLQLISQFASRCNKCCISPYIVLTHQKKKLNHHHVHYHPACSSAWPSHATPQVHIA